MWRLDMFYGWYIVWATVALAVYNSAVLIYGFTAFLDPIAAGLGWTYTQISLAVSLRGLEQGALNPVFGSLVDRFSARSLNFWGTCTVALGLFCLSRVTNLAMFYVSFLIMGLGGSLAFSMVPQVVIARWFRRDIGKASGLYSMGLGAGGLFLPLIVKLIDAYGWRTCILGIGIGTLVLGIPLSFIFRNRPEEYGLHPDGRAPETPDVHAAGRQGPGTGLHGVELKQALKMRAFWLIGISTMFQYMAWSAVATHIMPFLSSMGIKRSTGAMVATSYLLMSLFLRYPLGWLSDTLDKRYVNGACIAMLSVSVGSLWFIRDGSLAPLVVLVILTGFGAAGLTPIRVPFYREYFGVRSFGKIYGIGNIFPTLGGIAGAPLAGWVFDSRGSYHIIWPVLAAANLIGVFAMFMTPPSARVEGHGDRESATPQ
jgi:MFS transporter, OFA family, oxalate/formate antiporter